MKQREMVPLQKHLMQLKYYPEFTGLYEVTLQQSCSITTKGNKKKN